MTMYVLLAPVNDCEVQVLIDLILVHGRFID